MNNPVSKPSDDRIVEQQGLNILILYSVANPYVRYDYAKKHNITITHGLEYRWLRDASDPTSVLGNDYIVLTKREALAAKKRGLFNSFNLF